MFTDLQSFVLQKFKKVLPIEQLPSTYIYVQTCICTYLWLFACKIFMDCKYLQICRGQFSHSEAKIFPC